jgi:hypothetical protein
MRARAGTANVGFGGNEAYGATTQPMRPVYIMQIVNGMVVERVRTHRSTQWRLRRVSAHASQRGAMETEDQISPKRVLQHIEEMNP